MSGKPALRALILASALGGACAPQARAQGAPATITVRVRDERGRPFRGGSVALRELNRSVMTDAEGLADLGGLAPGPVRIVVRAIGYRPLDTTVVLKPGRHDTLTIALRQDEWEKRTQEEDAKRLVQQRIADSMRKANGGIDSIARGLVALDTTFTFGYERFGLDLLAAALDSTSSDSSRILSPLGAGQALAIALLAIIRRASHV